MPVLGEAEQNVILYAHVYAKAMHLDFSRVHADKTTLLGE
jgi:hypothetical protein